MKEYKKMTNHGLTESNEPLKCNRFEFEIEPYKDITPKEFDILEELRTSCWRVDGIGTDTITAFFYDNENVDFYRLLKGCTFRAIGITQYAADHSVRRKLHLSVKEKANVFMSPLDWSKAEPVSIIVAFELENFDEQI